MVTLHCGERTVVNNNNSAHVLFHGAGVSRGATDQPLYLHPQTCAGATLQGQEEASSR